MEGSFVRVNYQGDANITSNSNKQAVEERLNLPPGFRFHPTDEEIITHYLIHKVLNSNFTATAIGEVDLNRCEPWDLPKKAKMGEKEWYFFCQRDRKYPTGMRTNRATESGYWKATGKDKEIYNKPGKGGGGGGGGKQLVGMKKTLVFYKGRAPKGEKSDWVMHEFRLEGNFSYYKLPKSAKDEWVVCRVIHKNTTLLIKPSPTIDLTRMNSFVEGLLDSPSLPPLLDSAFFNNSERANVSSSTNTNTNGIISSSNVQNSKETSLANKYPITTTLSADGKTIYYHQFQMQPQNHTTSTTIFDPVSTNYQMPNSIFYSQNPYELHQQKYDHLIPNLAKPYNVEQNTNEALERQCKVEQFSSNNQSMVSRSQDTGLSADITTDISSSKQEDNREKRRRFNDIDEDHSVIGPLSDLDTFWSY